MSIFLSGLLSLIVFFLIVLPLVIYVIYRLVKCPDGSSSYGLGEKLTESCYCDDINNYVNGEKCETCPEKTNIYNEGNSHPNFPKCKCPSVYPNWNDEKKKCDL
jgi:hypothetical protein